MLQAQLAMCQGFPDRKARPSEGKRTGGIGRRCPKPPSRLDSGTTWLENAFRAVILRAANNKGCGNRFLGEACVVYHTSSFFYVLRPLLSSTLRSS